MPTIKPISLWNIGEDTEVIVEEDEKNFEILVKCFETVLSGKKFNIKEAKNEWGKVRVVLNKNFKPVQSQQNIIKVMISQSVVILRLFFLNLNRF